MEHWITIAILIDREETAPVHERTAAMVFAGRLTDAQTYQSVADALTLQELKNHAEDPPIADAENGPSEDDVPLIWSTDFVRESFYVVIEHHIV